MISGMNEGLCSKLKYPSRRQIRSRNQSLASLQCRSLTNRHNRHQRNHRLLVKVIDYAVWKRILRAVEELQRAVPKSGETVH